MDKITRRYFFKKSVKTVLPIIAAITVPGILTSCDEPDGGGSSSSSSGCSGCSHTCKTACGDTCKANMAYHPASCSGSTCKNACMKICKTGCYGGCKYGSK